MQYIGCIFNKLLRNHVYKIIVIHLISYQPFERLGPAVKMSPVCREPTSRHTGSWHDKSTISLSGVYKINLLA